MSFSELVTTTQEAIGWGINPAVILAEMLAHRRGLEDGVDGINNAYIYRLKALIINAKKQKKRVKNGSR